MTQRETWVPLSNRKVTSVVQEWLRVVSVLRSVVRKSWYDHLDMAKEVATPLQVPLLHVASREMRFIEATRLGGYFLRSLMDEYRGKMRRVCPVPRILDHAYCVRSPCSFCDYFSALFALQEHLITRDQVPPRRLDILAWLDGGGLSYASEGFTTIIVELYTLIYSEIQLRPLSDLTQREILEVALLNAPTISLWKSIMSTNISPTTALPEKPSRLQQRLTVMPLGRAMSQKLLKRFVAKMLHVRFRELLADYNSDAVQSHGQLRAPLKSGGKQKKKDKEKKSNQTK